MKTNTVKRNVPKGWLIRKIKDVLSFEQPGKYIVESTAYTPLGKTPVLTANKSFILGHTNEDFGIYKNTPAIIFDDFTTDSKYVDFDFKIKSSAIKILKTIDENTNLKFVFEIIKSIDFPIESHKRHYISQYQEQEIIIPLLPEQEKIAEILSAVDKEIEAVNSTISETEKLKKALVKKLFFTQEKSKKYKIKDIGEVTSSKRVMVSDYVDEGVPFYRSTEIIKKSKNIPILSSYYISKEKFDFFKNKFGAPEKNDLLITAVGTIGDVYMVQDETFYFKDGNTIWIRKIKDSILPEYFRMILASSYYRDILNAISGGSSQKALTIQKLESVEIPVPPKIEQEGLVKILTSIEQSTNIQKQLRDKLKKLKKGLMSDLLSGKVRVIK